jgi:uncharacterized protein (TIGR02594 family)
MPSKSKDEIQRIQHQLARKGFDPGAIDGVWGRLTEAAVRRFQAAHGLVADGIVGPITHKTLFGDEPKTEAADNPAIPWFQEARRLIGVREVVGPGNEPKIIDWAKGRGIDYRSDDIPWCGLYVAHCVGSTLASEKLPNNPLGAREWMKFGAPCEPGLGAVLVFWRGSRNGWQGHVGFYAGEDKQGAFHVLGGNQGNSVSVTRIAKDRLLGARWPSTAPIAAGGRVQLAANTTFFSTNEA